MARSLGTTPAGGEVKWTSPQGAFSTVILVIIITISITDISKAIIIITESFESSSAYIIFIGAISDFRRVRAVRIIDSD